MTVDSYRNFRLRVKYIGVARMLELQGIHSFLTLQTELVRIFGIQSLQCSSCSASTNWLRDVHVGCLKDFHIGCLMIHTFTDGSLQTCTHFFISQIYLNFPCSFLLLPCLWLTDSILSPLPLSGSVCSAIKEKEK